MNKLSIQDVEFLAHRLASETMSWDEPIPDFKTRFPGILESCLATPFATFGGKDFYKTLIEKASILFYLMVKNHPFQNGNKRIAVTAMLTFLAISGKWLHVGNKQLYSFAVWVASSPAELKGDTVNAVQTFLRKYLV
jgi:death-on-curing family protein